MKKRILAMMLCVAMLASLAVSATEETSAETTGTVVTTETGEEDTTTVPEDTEPETTTTESETTEETEKESESESETTTETATETTTTASDNGASEETSAESDESKTVDRDNTPTETSNIPPEEKDKPDQNDDKDEDPVDITVDEPEKSPEDEPVKDDPNTGENDTSANTESSDETTASPDSTEETSAPEESSTESSTVDSTSAAESTDSENTQTPSAPPVKPSEPSAPNKPSASVPGESEHGDKHGNDKEHGKPEQPVADPTACNCENAPENLANHADSCPRKNYIKAQFEGKTAEEIYSAWDEYDAATQSDILDMLATYNSTVLEQLEKLMNGTGVAIDGIPDGAEVDVAVVDDYDSEELEEAVFGLSEILFALDINVFDADNQVWQPDEGETVTVTLDAKKLGLADGQTMYILHDHNGEFRKLGQATVENGELSFETDGFSVFYGYTVDFEYEGTWYSIGGGSNIYLYELFAALGISDRYSASDVNYVEFSDPDLIDVSEVIVDGYTGETGWYLQTLAPFDTEETLVIYFNNGKEIALNVYDAAYDTLSNNLALNNGDSINATTISGNVTITVNGTVTVNGQITINAGASLTINGGGTLKRGSSYLGRMFSVTGGTLTINNGITIDGGASWSSTQVLGSTRYKLTVNNYGATGTKDGQTTYVTSAAIYVGGGDATNGYKTGTVNLTGVTMQNLYTASGQAPAIHVTGDSGTTINGNYSTVNMTNVVIQNCATMSGQAITLFNDCLANLNGCKYLNNYSGGTYAGTLKAGGPGYFSQLNMTNCEASGNYSSGWGGVILWAANNTCGTKSSKATIDGCTFTNNKARYLGGALSNEAVMEVKNTTIMNNTAMAGGGIATFPFTLTETHEGGGNACGLTLGSGNTIQGNTALASGNFTPFSSTDAGAGGDDSTITAQITYTGGGGGVWCYMNKPAWKCELNIGNGNTINSNTAKNAGGGVYVHHVDGIRSTLNITGATITKNSAVNGGGVAVNDAAVNISSGDIKENTASSFGGGIYVSSSDKYEVEGTSYDKGSCNVSDSGSVSENTAANGGGIYIHSGSLSVSGGVISENNAKGEKDTVNTPESTGKTALDQTAGVGGGIYIATGTFTMSSKTASVGIYGNTATFAADDAYASGTDTTLTLPDIANMALSGTTYETAEGWFIDYVSGDTEYKSQKPFEFDNNGRYRTAGNIDQRAGTIENGTSYYCLTLGRIPSLVITKEISGNSKPDHSFIYRVVGVNGENEPVLDINVVIPAGDFVQDGNKMTASVTITNLVAGVEYTVTELTDWSWRYQYDSSYTKTDTNGWQSATNGITFTLPTNGEETVFTNTREKIYWLAGDWYCSNWWGGTEIDKRKDYGEEP